ncbi:Delta and Notch-like epidermal growth factor-related receptor [Portunus trituberculatus]|uniref:Delta and Notch-like epidermal growth factor-related receptor n=1 Tax=Portunus trituberculatus TaxID=210409 RepID=A0A5B7ISQ1_PORTR|nr:Delta and Notch-like epidermal growth factor-related receptor [Portunus trituberculatus]
MYINNFKPLDKWQSFKAVRGGIKTYAWTSARSHVYLLIHYATAFHCAIVSIDPQEHFECQCCDGYIGSHCEEMDACSGGPCLNAGICVDIQEGHDGDTFQCLCPYAGAAIASSPASPVSPASANTSENSETETPAACRHRPLPPSLPVTAATQLCIYPFFLIFQFFL